jgi:hypothetical protein
LRDGELRPASVTGPREFLHVTRNEQGEATAAGWGDWAVPYREREIQRVRFTLDAADFEPWRDVFARYPEIGFLSRLSKTSGRSGRATPKLGSVASIRCRSGA